jgi:hypothetical protein
LRIETHHSTVGQIATVAIGSLLPRREKKDLPQEIVSAQIVLVVSEQMGKGDNETRGPYGATWAAPVGGVVPEPLREVAQLLVLVVNELHKSSIAAIRASLEFGWQRRYSRPLEQGYRAADQEEDRQQHPHLSGGFLSLSPPLGTDGKSCEKSPPATSKMAVSGLPCSISNLALMQHSALDREDPGPVAFSNKARRWNLQIPRFV